MKDKFTINNKEINLIAEIGNNHNGSIQRAFKLIDLAKKAGVKCVKFQMRNLEELYTSRSLKKIQDDLSSEYVIDLLKKFELSTEEHFKVYKYCNENNLEYICTPWDQKSLSVLKDFKVNAYKLASADLTNIPLIKKLTETKKPLLISTGMSTRKEIIKTAKLLKLKKTKFMLLHCNSTYPAPYEDINLNWMSELKKIHDHIGYSGHERGIYISVAAFALGAEIIEKHFTLNRNMDGPDHAASLELADLKKLVIAIDQVKKSLGTNKKERSMSQGEMMNRETLSKSLVASRNIKKNEIIKRHMISIKSPGQGISPQFLTKLIGKKISRNLKKEDYFFLSDIEDVSQKPKKYKFKRPWGIPVRYHDFKKFSNLIKPDFWEFHLSYSDLKLKISDFLDEIKYDQNFIVHAPELFENSNLLDLASIDKEYRKNSINELNRVIDETRKLKYFFPKTHKALIVTNIGGFSLDKNLSKKEKATRYEIFLSSLTSLNLKEDVEIIPQTMAPFPWHFGGQRYQNLFVKSEEIVEICFKNNLRICLDISHSFLTCNFFKEDFYEFISKVSPYIAHLHLGDGKNFNGEGLQLGQGDIDFERLFEILNHKCSNVTFIPEIWQGHKNDGLGFWEALDKLEKLNV